MEVVEGMGFTENCFGLGWDHLGSFRFLCVRYLYVDPVLSGACRSSGPRRNPLEFGGDYLPGLGRQAFNLSDLAVDLIRIGRDFDPD
jgi:hypothetical protein